MSLERIQGTTVSHLFTHNALTPERFQKFMKAISNIHSSNGVYTERELSPPFDALFRKDQPKQSMYANYASKLKSRYSKFKQNIYESLGDTVPEFYEKLLQKLTEYENNDQGIHSKVIHGDPVFSNAILTPHGDFKFLDMRGSIGVEYTTAGDVLYDLAKIYQSLFGYDFVLLDKGKTELTDLLGPAQERNMKELRTIFWDTVKQRYGIDQDGPIKYLTAGLYFSLLPFHDPPLHSNFYQLAVRTFHS
jgi:hypothetical protein